MQGKGALTIWILTGVLVSYLRPVEAEKWSDPANLSNGDLTGPVGLLRLLPRQSETNVRI